MTLHHLPTVDKRAAEVDSGTSWIGKEEGRESSCSSGIPIWFDYSTRRRNNIDMLMLRTS